MDWLSTIVGAAIGFLASIGTMLVQRWIDKVGKLKLYCVTVRGDSTLDSIGFIKSNSEPGKITFILPIKLEIQNTSNTTRVIRDVSMWLYNNGKPIKEMVQVQSTVRNIKTNGISKEKETLNYGGDKNMYSFVVPPRSIQREHCSYILKINENETQDYFFNETRLSYYDERDKKHVYAVRRFDNPWIPSRMNGDDTWFQLKE